MLNEKVMEYFTNPRNVGSMENASCIGDAGNPADGDTGRLYLRIEEERIVDAKVKVSGCPTAIAPRVCLRSSSSANPSTGRWLCATKTCQRP
jgi:NifU-like protein involved in Fe-S cluster formation